jgi:hypothetical protein
MKIKKFKKKNIVFSVIFLILLIFNIIYIIIEESGGTAKAAANSYFPRGTVSVGFEQMYEPPQGLSILIDDSNEIYIGGYAKRIFSRKNYPVLCKQNSYGVETWMRVWNSSGPGSIYDIASDSLNNIYAVGNASNQMLLLKYDSSGDIQWNLTWGLNDYTVGCGIAVDDSNNIYITGYSYNVSRTVYKILLNKYDTIGNLLSNKTWGGEGIYVEARKLTIDLNNNVYITGFIKNPLTKRDVFTIKYDSDLNELWSQAAIWGESDNEECYNIVVDNSDNIYVTGYVNTSSNGEGDFLLLKYNPAGELLWYRSWGPANSTNIAYGICVDNFNDVYIAGLNETIIMNMTQYKLVLMKYDRNGNFLGVNNPGFNEFELAQLDITLLNNDIIIVGYFHLFRFDYPRSTSNYMVLMIIDIYAGFFFSIVLIISLVSLMRGRLSSTERAKRKVQKSDEAFRDYKEIKENIDNLKQEIVNLNKEKRYIEAIKKLEILEGLLKKSKSKAKHFDKELIVKINQEIENIPSEIQQLKLAMAPRLIRDEPPKVMDKAKKLAKARIAVTKISEKEEIEIQRNVFLSYSTLDSEYFMIEKVAEKLKTYPKINDVLFWEADSQENIVEYMEETLRHTNVFILFCSANSFKSKAVKDEWQSAFQLRKKDLMKIVPVYEKEEDIPYLLMPLLNVKFSKENFDEFIEDLYNEILR